MSLASFRKQSGLMEVDQGPTRSGQKELRRSSISPNCKPEDEERSSISQTRSSTVEKSGSSDGRFNMLRYRHASDPQLSTRFRDQGPEPPSTPPSPDTAPAPVIGFTSPKRDTYEKPRSVKHFWARQQSFRTRSSNVMRDVDGTTDSNGRNSIGGSMNHELSPRPSTTYEGAPPPYGQLVPPAPRLSGCSSTSEEQFAYAATTTTHTTVSTTTTFFKIPRRKNKKPEPLFPLPARPATARPALSESSRTQSEISPAKSLRSSPYANSPAPSTQLLRPIVQSHSTNDVPLLRSSTWNAAVAASSANPSTHAPSMLRNDSTTSVPTSPTNEPFSGDSVRARSGTMDSTDSRLEEESTRNGPTPPSGRNSMASSTLGRNSIAGLRSLTSRFRSPSEALSTRNSPFGLPPSQSNGSALSREALVMPDREDGETAGRYYNRLEAELPKKSIASLLSKSSDPFNHDVLRSLLRTFKYYEVPLDMAIRQFLWGVDLPGEAQQIDRVISAFAERYHECNPHIFINFDQVYLVAYSLIILHSDLFNKNNKRKMQKIEYQKNTGGHGIDEEILGYFYDNIQWAEFIAQEPNEDEAENKAKSKLRKGHRNTSRIGLHEPTRSSKADPYDFIIDPNKELEKLGPSLKTVFNLDDTYRYCGTSERLEVNRLRDTFCSHGSLPIISSRSRPEAHAEDTTNEDKEHKGIVSINVVKVGILWRKDVKRRKTQRPWQQWGAILSHSKLYFFKNTGWVRTLLSQFEAHGKGSRTALIYKPALEEFKPDFSVDTNNAIALLDSSYDKHKNAFVLSRNADYYEEVLLAEGEMESNDWIAKINYAAAFSTAGLQVDKPDEDHEAGVARMSSMPTKIGQADDTLPSAKQKLEERLRNARHLCMLAPFSSKTRTELLNYSARIAHRIRWSRYEVWKLQCHRDILSKYLDLEDAQEPSSHAVSAQQSLSFAKAITPRTPSRPTALSRLNSKASALISPQKTKAGKLSSSSLLGSPSMGRSKDSEKVDAVLAPSSGHVSEIMSEEGSRYTLPPLNLEPAALSVTSDGSTDRATDRPVSSGTESMSIDGIARRISIASALPRKETSNGKADSPFLVALPSTSLPAERDHELVQVTSNVVESIESDVDQTATAGGVENRTKPRRSLQRTLRDSREFQGLHSKGSRKGKDSATSAGTEEDGAGSETEGISRGTGSFTLHGKKASVITFGSEWQNMSAEERLRVRKQGKGDDVRYSTQNMSEIETEVGSSPILRVRSIRDENPRQTRTRDMSPLRHDISHLAMSPPQSPRLGVEVFGKNEEQAVFHEPFSTVTARKLYEAVQDNPEGRYVGEEPNGRHSERLETFFKDTSSDEVV